MVRVLSFSAIEILRALLNKTKTQTIRPVKQYQKGVVVAHDDIQGDIYRTEIKDKPPRFKVGETVRLEWKSRNSPKGSYFCCNCGRKTTGKNDEWDNEMCPVHGSCDAFEKILGYGKITEVFKIQLSNRALECGIIENGKLMMLPPGPFGFGQYFTELAKRDGFTDAETMFSWFDSHYDLKTPKTFWVYRWRKA